jgi:hypothetical protein
VPAPDPALLLAAAGPVLGYGPGPGMELIPYFLAMLAWAGLAVLGILLSPLRALVRRVRGKRPEPVPAPAAEVAPPAPTTEGTVERA